MPNVNRPSGLSPVKYLSGADWDGKVNMYYIDPTVITPIYVGDLVDLSGSGDPVRGIPGAVLATAGNTPSVGVVVSIGINPEGGPYINPNDLTAVSRPTGAQAVAYYAAVVDDPNVLFEIQEGGAGAAFTAANIGENRQILYSLPVTGGRLSGTTLNNNVAANDAGQLKLMGLVRRFEGNGSLNTFGAYAKWLVTINNHRYKAATANL